MQMLIYPKSHLFLVPSRPPDSLQAVATSSTEIEVSWDEVPPQYANGIITSYEVMYTRLNYLVDQETIMATWAPHTSVLLSELGKYTAYRISVRASNSVGRSDFSAPAEERTLDDGNVCSYVLVLV